MTRLDKNGIRILTKEETKKESLQKEYIEGGNLNPLKERIEETAIATAAKRKAGKKEEKSKIH